MDKMISLGPLWRLSPLPFFFVLLLSSRIGSFQTFQWKRVEARWSSHPCWPGARDLFLLLESERESPSLFCFFAVQPSPPPAAPLELLTSFLLVRSGRAVSYIICSRSPSVSRLPLAPGSAMCDRPRPVLCPVRPHPLSFDLEIYMAERHKHPFFLP